MPEKQLDFSLKTNSNYIPPPLQVFGSSFSLLCELKILYVINNRKQKMQKILKNKGPNINWKVFHCKKL